MLQRILGSHRSLRLNFLVQRKKALHPITLKLNKILREGIHDENGIANVLKYANGLPSLQKHCQSLQNQVWDRSTKTRLERDTKTRLEEGR
jgi:hypothetical protein